MLNTQQIIDTLRQPPCNWYLTVHDAVWYGVSPEDRATLQIDWQATMQAVFASDMPEAVAARNMNYLLAFVAAAGAKNSIPFILAKSAILRTADPYTEAHVFDRIHVTLTIDKQRSITTLTLRPCRARVYDVPKDQT